MKIGVDAFLSDAQQQIAQAFASSVDEQIPGGIDQELREIFNQVAKGEEPQGLVKTRIDSIDRISGGLWPGLMTVLGARPGMGKSALAMNIAINVAMWVKSKIEAGDLERGGVVYFSLEDTRETFARRVLARASNIDLHLLNVRSVAPDRYANLVDGISRMSNLPLVVDDTGGLTSEDIWMRSMQHQIAVGTSLIIVDHMLELRDPGKDETETITRAAHNIRDMAKKMKVPVLALTQLNRNVEHRRDKRPTLADLKQSGKLEEAARCVMFLYREGYYVGEDESHNVELNIAKHTNGKTGVVHLWADMTTMLFRGWGESDGTFPTARDTDQADRSSKDGEFKEWQDRYDY